MRGEARLGSLRSLLEVQSIVVAIDDELMSFRERGQSNLIVFRRHLKLRDP